MRAVSLALHLTVSAGCVASAFAQTTYTWQQLKDKFETTNPTLKAAQLSIDESKASEITAWLRPNPDFSLTADGTQLAPSQGIWRPFAGTDYVASVSMLHERAGKRELRLESAKKSSDIAGSSYLDQERGLIFNLRSAFVQVLQAKAVLQNARENLTYWDRELGINRTRLGAGDIARMDLNRLVLQRVQFESDLETATVNLRTAKIQLLTLLNDRTPIEQFDVSGSFEFSETLMPLEQFRNVAVAERPDLKVAMENVELAKAQHQLAVANGSTDPTWSVWYTKNPSFNNPFDNQTVGASVTIPLRIFDRNQGEKERTEIDIRRNQRLRDAATAQVFSDVDSAYVTLQSAVNLLRPYRDTYLNLATNVRDTMALAYRNGGASLLDYQDAEKSYRDTRLAYLNLIGSYLTAAAQMNQAVGREVIQ
ncbi:MAG TPA: TolC family protein [Bryobacteraceae bacterium]|nr:TolC family protein [Bryobacteraceae bacterium]